MSHFILENVEEKTKPALVQFLKRYEDKTLFLHANLESCGFRQTTMPNSGNFKLIRKNGDTVAVFCLSVRGNLLIMSEILDPIFELVLDSCMKETVQLTGLIGDWKFTSQFWNHLKYKKMISTELFAEREVLYTLDLFNKTTHTQKETFNTQ